MREFYLERDGLKIYVQEFLPEVVTDGIEKYPAILISHGFGGGISDKDNTPGIFTKKGIAVFRLDFAGGARANETRSQGATTDMTIWTEREDLETLIDYVKTLSYIDAADITLMGYSQGGFVSGITAAKRNEDIKKLIMVFPALCLCDDARRGMLGGAVYDLAAVPEVINCPNGMAIGRKFHEEVIKVDPIGALSGFNGETLILHGMEDFIVHYTYSIRASRKAYNPSKCSLQLFEKMGHGVSPNVYEAVYDSMLFFMAGKKEILTIKVIITGEEIVEETSEKTVKNVYFTGFSDNDYFKGAINPGAVDVQTTVDNVTSLSASYSLTGVDSDGKKCTIKILNQKKGEYFMPEISTDSEKLSFLNNSELYATIEGHNSGVTIRIYA